MVEKLDTKEVLKITLITLRRMRGAAEQEECYRNPRSTTAQRILSDAEALGLSCAETLVNTKIPEEDSGKSWSILIENLSKRYNAAPVSRHAGRYNEESALERLYPDLSLLNCFSGEPFEQYSQDFNEMVLGTGNRSLFGLSGEDIFDNQIVVFSPLSTDYLKACLFQRHVQLFVSPNCFRLKPIILDRCLRPVAVPVSDNESIADFCKTRVFVEDNLSNSTLRASLNAVRIFFWK